MNDVMGRTRYFTLLAMIFIAYTATAKLGLSIQPVNDFATLIWPPTGIALAALILWGYRLAPAVFLGAFVANFTTGATLVVSLGIASGNTLEAVLGTFLLRSFVGMDFSFGHLRESIAFIICGVVLAPLLAATIGAITLELGGMISAADFLATWITWWIGDALGALVVAPFLLRWFSNPYYDRSTWQYVEMAFVIVAVSAVTFVIFWTPIFPFLYLAFVPLVWATLRTGPRGLTLSILLMAIIALSGTLTGHGPYASYPAEQKLLLLQTFIATTTAMFLMFVSTVEDRRRSTKQLATQVLELESAMEKIRFEDQAKTEFLAILAHELRNPLAPILSSLELIKVHARGRADTLRLISTAEKNAHNMSKLLDDLLEISRISGKKFKLKTRSVDIRECIQQAVQAVEPMIRERGHTLERATPAEPLYLDVDPLRIEQILVNLLSNAVKYTPPRGRIALTCTRDARYLLLTVRDTGVGIEKEMQGRIFEPFVQINRDSSVLGGVGIGLSLTKRLVEMHGGTIEVLSEGEGRGSEFRVRIPLIAPKESAGGSEELEQRHASDAEIGTREGVGRGASGKRPRPKLMPLDILVVDDNVDAATALGKLLEARGHDVMLCHDGASTLTSAESFKPDAIFIDIGLPDMSGYEVARELRKRGSPSALIALTGYGQESDKAKAREAGFAYHLTKPVSLAQIEEALAIVTASP